MKKNYTKKLLTVAIAIMGATALNAQVKVGSNPTNIASRANFQVESRNGRHFFIDSLTGQVGVNTLTPSKIITIEAPSGYSDVSTFLSHPNYSGETLMMGDYGNLNNSTGIYFRSFGVNLKTAGTGKMYFMDNTDTNMVINGNNGYVGIGTTAPTNTLDVNGTARIRTLASGAATDSVLTVDANGVVNSRSANALASGTEPWNKLYTLEGSTSNLDNIYTKGHVTIGGNGNYASPARLFVTDSQTVHATSLLTMPQYATVVIKPDANNSTFMGMGTIPGGNAMYLQHSNSTGTSAYDLAMNPWGGNVGIGTTTPTHKLVVNFANDMPTHTPSSAYAARFIGESNNATAISIENYGSGRNGLIGFSGLGTPTAPTAITTGTEMLHLEARGWNGTGYNGGSKIRINAAENFTPTANGSDILFSTIPLGSTTLSDRMIIQANGNIGINTTTTNYEGGSSASRYLTIAGTVQSGGAAGSGRIELVNPGTLSAGSQLGFLTFNGSINGTSQANIRMASILGIVEGTADATNGYGAALAFYTKLNTDASQIAARMYIASNGNVGIGTITPRAKLDVAGTDAIIVPVGDNSQRPATPVQGMIRFNTTSGVFEGYNGSAWVNLN